MVDEFWAEGGDDGPVVRGFSDEEARRIVCKGAHRIPDTNWWHCEVGTNGGTDDWSVVHDKIQALADRGLITTKRGQLTATKNITRREAVGVDENDEPVMENKRRSVQELAAEHSFGVRGGAPRVDRSSKETALRP